jgi:outer membrane protein insertion porin family
VTVLAAVSAPVLAQGRADQTTVIDSIAVVGNKRVPRATIVAQSAIPTGQTVSYRDIQRAIQTLYATGQYRDVQALQATVNGREVLRLVVQERPLLAHWMVRGAEKVSEGSVRGRVHLTEARPYDEAAAANAVGSIDSLYKHEGYYLAKVKKVELLQPDSTMRVVFDVEEGSRIAISQVVIEGNKHFTAGAVAGNMKVGPEGFWWFQKGEYNVGELERDLHERLPDFYGGHGYVDFQVLRDTLVVDDSTGKGTLIVSVDEGDQYQVGNFEVVGNRHFSTDQVEQYYPFTGQVSGLFGLGGPRTGPAIFDQKRWDEATQSLKTLYYNNGYIYSDVRPVMERRGGAAGVKKVDLRWQIVENEPAIINRVNIVGNSSTHEGVIRRAIIVIPGDVFRQDALIQSYRNIANLGFFQEPLPFPDTRPSGQGQDVDITFHVEEKSTGNVNFGASVGQGTGLGGFIGLDEPNILGLGKRMSFQWQFGRNINDFNVSYNDPSIADGLLSGSISLHNTRLRYTIADLGQITTRGGTVQIGLPLFGSRYSRIFTSYTLEESNYDSPTLLNTFSCSNCLLSAVAISVTRDKRIDLPFPTGGAMHQITVSQDGGPLGGDGNFRRLTMEGRWYAPLGQMGGSATSTPLKFVLGLTAKSGFVWGRVGPHFRQLFSLGGTQYGIPLRGYDEFAITPRGFDPNATGSNASTVDAFGRSYIAMTGEVGLRVSQAFYVNTFLDAGNVWASPSQFDPTRLFRGAGIGLSVLSPLGPLGLDYAYGFDRTDAAGNPAPSWKLHFKIGNFF